MAVRTLVVPMVAESLLVDHQVLQVQPVSVGETLWSSSDENGCGGRSLLLEFQPRTIGRPSCW